LVRPAASHQLINLRKGLLLTTTDATGIAPESRARRRLTPDEQREIARWYAEAKASNADICQRFGISDPTLYRVLQREGVPLRRGNATTIAFATADRASKPSRTRAAGNPSAKPLGASAPGAALEPSDALDKVHFRIEFRAERVFDAHDISDALRQAQAAGAVDVQSITRAS